MNVSFVILSLAVLSACSQSKEFKSSVATGSVDKGPAAPIIENAEISTPAIPPAPQPAATPSIDACKSDGVKITEETIAFAARENECNFGQGINRDQENGMVTAVETTTAQLKLPTGRICSIGLKTSETTQMRYDDMMIFSIDSKIVFASSDTVMKFLQKDGKSIWDPTLLIGNRMDFEGAPFCIGGDEACVIPPTEKAGPFAVNIPPEKFSDISEAITGKATVPVTLSVTGDDDPAKDCHHSAVDIRVSIQYVP